MKPSRLELWGGVEGTYNRVADRYIDQLVLSGHADRLEDLDLFAGLGTSAIRYPVLWERVAPGDLAAANWLWTDERLAGLRDRGVRPIVGLLHHGNGPPHTSLLDPQFPGKLAGYAAAVAQRYPWVDAYTPVNEPLTTARFSGLYGLWYPHGRDHATCWRLLLTQCRAVVLSMRAIREVRPDAQLIQSEDLGKVFSSPALRYQAEFENNRRWLTFDLLCGRVDRHHPLWGRLLADGLSPADLEWFLENTCPPDIVGVDHYLSSERYLHEDLDRYPADAHSGNGKHAYADVLAARVRAEGSAGIRALLQEAALRYGLPVAMTEAHNGCTREEQMRWFVEVWRAALDLRNEGIDIRAVTAWSLLGAHGWDTLVTSADGRYEPGVYDLRSPVPRPTAMVSLLRDLASHREPTHPVLATPGWWRRPIRLTYGHAVDDQGQIHEAPEGGDEMRTERWPHVRPVLICGAGGTLGRAFTRRCEQRGLPYRALTRAEMDIADLASVEYALDTIKPWAVINAAGYARVDEAETDPYACYRDNVTGPVNLADACAAAGAQLVSFSSDLVFDGIRGTPYVESDPVNPLNVFGRSKAEAERRIAELYPGALIIRTGAMFGPWDECNVVTTALREISSGRAVVVCSDDIASPTCTPDLVDAALDLLVDGEHGIWHLTNDGAVSQKNLISRAARMAGVKSRAVVGRPMRDLQLPAAHPLYSALASERGRLLPPLDDAIARYTEERKAYTRRVAEALRTG